MSPDIAIPAISNRMVQLFAEAVVHEVEMDKLPSILAKLSIDVDEIEEDAIARLSPTAAALLYASLQQALRLFYGRGARGILLRIGRSMWDRMTVQVSFREKAELEIARRLPVPARRRRVLELLADRLREGGGATSTHTLDMDLLLVDASSAATANQTLSEPICSVTVGLIQEALFWATGQEVDVDEISCKAAGAPTCEFKILLASR